MIQRFGNPQEPIASVKRRPKTATQVDGGQSRFADLQTVVDAEDRIAWDRYVARTVGGHHVQTSQWSRVKATTSWTSTRTELRQSGDIVGGFQMLLRPFPIYGALGLVPKGPLLDHCELLLRMMEEIHQTARRNRVQYLIVQPPDDREDIADFLRREGFSTSPFKALPVAMTAVDLRHPLEDILAGMKSKTRYNIRYAIRKGIQCRQGDAADLPLFHEMLMATAHRKGFEDNSLEYFRTMYDAFSKEGCVQLFVAEYRGKAVSAMLAICLGDTVIYKKGGWSGECGKFFPNEAIHWCAIQWAKARGFDWYNFEYIDPEAADAITRGQPLPKSLLDSVTRFKLGFGGNILRVPDAQGYFYNPIFRWGHDTVYPCLMKISLVDRFLDRLKSR